MRAKWRNLGPSIDLNFFSLLIIKKTKRSTPESASKLNSSSFYEAKLFPLTDINLAKSGPVKKKNGHIRVRKKSRFETPTSVTCRAPSNHTNRQKLLKFFLSHLEMLKKPQKKFQQLCMDRFFCTCRLKK